MLTTLLARLDPAHNKKLQAAVILCGGLLLLNAAFYATVVRPGASSRVNQTAHIADLRKRYAVGVLYQKQRKDIGTLVANMPTQKDMPLIVKELEQTARKRGLRVGPVNYDIPRSGAEGITMLTFSFPVNGRYADLKRFVYDVETSMRLVGIEKLDIKADKNGEAMMLTLLTYIRMGDGGHQQR